MNDKQILILDCNGRAKPAICFNLEIAGFDMRVVTDEAEAINLLANSRVTQESFSELLVNNPYLNVDIIKIVEDVKSINIDIPVVFVKESKSLMHLVQSLKIEHRRPRIFHAEPTGLVNLLTMFRGQGSALHKNQRKAS